MHICFVESGYPPPQGGGGGAGTYVQLVGRELVQRGHQVSVVATGRSDCPAVADDKGIKVYRPPFRNPLHWYLRRIPILHVGALSLRYLESGWHLYRFIERLHQSEPFDVAEFSEGGDFWHAVWPGFPYVSHLHGSRYIFLKMSQRQVGTADWYQRELELFFIRRAPWVVAPCRAMLEIVSREAGGALERADVIPYPLDVRLLQPPKSRGDQRQKRKVIHFAARNDPVKGADVLLQTVPLVRQNIPDVEFRLFGYEPNGAVLAEGVRCYPFVPKTELLQHYRQADVCVVPSRWDNSPNTVYEAMAAGKAVVASRVGGIPELVEEGQTGLLVPPDQPEALAHALVTLLLDDERRLNMGRQARRRVEELADLKKNVDQRLAIYTQTIEAFKQNGS